MNSIKNKSAKVDRSILIFGAGKIGRSFIGQLFSRGGYEVVFADVAETVVNELNRRRNYEVVIIPSEGPEEIIRVENVRAVNTSNKLQVLNEICNASILAVSVGTNALRSVIPLIAEGLQKRCNTNRNLAADIIIAENMLNASAYFRKHLSAFLPGDYPLEQLVGLIETSIGKMVPVVPKKLEKEDILKVYAEPYNTLILDGKAFKNAVPAIDGLAPKENIKAWVDRKLFIHNLGHAAAAYWGYYYNHDIDYVWEALENPGIFSRVKNTMMQASNILVKKYPEEFTEGQLTGHVDDLLYRFQNKALGDTIFRVGCDLPRKLGPEDRVAGAIKMAVQLGMPYHYILDTLFAGIYFRGKDEHGFMHPADKFFIEIFKKGIKEVLKTICGFDEYTYTEIYQKAKKFINKDDLFNNV